eukprot:scaffold651139_cov47-Prasinocladus_malaysianus.AAC.1
MQNHCRPLLRLARRHDEAPALKFLLPEAYCRPPNWNAGSHLMASDLRDGFRAAISRGKVVKDTGELEQ